MKLALRIRRSAVRKRTPKGHRFGPDHGAFLAERKQECQSCRSKLNETLESTELPKLSEEQEFSMNTSFYRSLSILVLALLTFSALHADVTTRYKTEITMNPAVSAMIAGALKGTDLATPQETALRLKGSKGVSSSRGFISIIDFSSKEMTLLDVATQRYAKMTSEQFVDEAARAIPEIPATARDTMTAMKTSVSPPRLTGRTAFIQSVEAEERETIISIEGPNIPNAPASPSIRMVMQLWSAKTGEVVRVPAIRELTGYSLYSYSTMNPIASIDKLVKQLPGFASAFEPLMKEMQKVTPMMRIHIDLFMPGMAAMLQRMAAGGDAAGTSADDSTPFLQMNQEVVELSAAPVPDSVFQIPEGYQEVSAAKLVQALLVKGKAAVQQ